MPNWKIVKLRRPLGPLDRNRSAWNRKAVASPPVVFAKENLETIEHGLWFRRWEPEQIWDVTNTGFVHLDADESRFYAEAITNALGPSAAETILDAPGPSHDSEDAMPDEAYYEDIDEGIDEGIDDALVDEIADELLEDVELEDELEYDGQGEGQELHSAGSFDPAALGLKEINNLAHFSVSSHKPGNGVPELLTEDLDKYWQSDGQQPHHLTIHFLRRVEIRAIRFYVDYNQDESYTPTLVNFSAGTGHHDLIEFASMPLSNPVGWQEVDLSQVGGGDDGKSLCCWIVQMQVKENHQNGKDTHIRAIKIYALDENAQTGDGIEAIEEVHDTGAGDISAERGNDEAEMYRLLETPRRPSEGRAGSASLSVPDFMNFEIR